MSFVEDLLVGDDYRDTGEMPSGKPYRVLEQHDRVEVEEEYATGEGMDTQEFPVMSGEEASEFLRRFDFEEDSDYPLPGEAGFSHEVLDGESFWAADFDSWDGYTIDLYQDGGGRIEVRAEDSIMGLFPRYVSLEFEFQNF